MEGCTGCRPGFSTYAIISVKSQYCYLFELIRNNFILQVETVDDYDEYCHYVAGLVGYGLSRLFHAAGTEDLAPDQLSNSMGLFLQVFS